MLMTTALAAHRLGVTHERLLDWVARKLLPIVGEDEEGHVLLREHLVLERGEALAADVPEGLRSPRLRQLWATGARPRVLPCGCTFAAGATPNSDPLIRCADAHALEAIARLTQAFAATAPREQFFQRLAEVARDAVACHLAGPAGGNNPRTARLRAPIVKTVGSDLAATVPPAARHVVVADQARRTSAIPAAAKTSLAGLGLATAAPSRKGD
jgi:hypothetical protein